MRKKSFRLPRLVDVGGCARTHSFSLLDCLSGDLRNLVVYIFSMAVFKLSLHADRVDSQFDGVSGLLSLTVYLAL